MPYYFSDYAFVGSRLHDNVEWRVYSDASFSAAPSGGSDFPFPSAGMITSGTTGLQHGSNGLARVANLSAGNYHLGMLIDGGTFWRSFSVNPSGEASNTVDFYGAVGDGTTDDTTAFTNAVTAISEQGGGVLIIPAGRYALTTVSIPSNVWVVGEGLPQIVSLNTVGGASLFTFSGITVSSTTLDSNGSPGDSTLSVVSTTAFTSGDYVLVYDDTYLNGIVGRNQEIAKIKSKTASILTLTSPLEGTYTVSQTATVVKVIACSGAAVIGVSFTVPHGKKGGAVSFDLAIDCFVRECSSFGTNAQEAFRMTQSLNCHVRNTSARTVVPGHPNFLIDEASAFCSITDCYSEGGAGDRISNNTHHCQYSGNVSRGNVLGLRIGDGLCRQITVEGNVIEGTSASGIVISYSRDIDLIGNRVNGAVGVGIGVQNSSGSVLTANTVRRVTGAGISVAHQCRDIFVNHNYCAEISSYNFTTSGANANIHFTHNRADDVSVNFVGGVNLFGNSWGGTNALSGSLTVGVDLTVENDVIVRGALDVTDTFFADGLSRLEGGVEIVGNIDVGAAQIVDPLRLMDALRLPRTNVATSGQIHPSGGLHICGQPSLGIVVTLPISTSVPSGTLCFIARDNQASLLRIDSSGADVIGGSAKWHITVANTGVALVSDGFTGWHFVFRDAATVIAV